jgi:glyoxylate reductase
MARVLVATPILSGCLDSLREHDLVEGEPASDSRAEILICDPTQAVDLPAQEGMPKLELIAVAGAGADAIDHRAAKARGITVVTAGDVLAETTADIAFGLIIAASRLMHDAELALRGGEWEGWRFVEEFGRDVHGATLGLVGFGAIGRVVGRRARGFEMEVLHHTRNPTGETGWIEHLDDLLRQSDIVSLHVPLTDETYHLIDEQRLSLLKPSAVLVNTARGAIVDEAALASALSNDRLFAAGLDVYESEPDVSPDLLQAPRTILLPHIGSATLRTRQAMLRRAGEKVRDFLQNKHK